MKLATKKAKLHKKLRVKDQTPGALIRKVNDSIDRTKTKLPPPTTQLGVAWRGLI